MKHYYRAIAISNSPVAKCRWLLKSKGSLIALKGRNLRGGTAPRHILDGIMNVDDESLTRWAITHRKWISPLQGRGSSGNESIQLSNTPCF